MLDGVLTDVVNVEAQPAQSIRQRRLLRDANKVIFDLTVSVVVLVIFAIPIGVIAIAIKLDSEGPVFFRQPRIGLRNKTFGVWKFRTMYVQQADLGGEMLTRRNDPRITRVGAFLRRTSLDELPQLLNVLALQMSLVGPRPHALSAKVGNSLYSEAVPEYHERHQVRPGITGWAQVSGWRGETIQVHQLAMRVQYDLDYIARQSLLFDLRILFMTPFCLIGEHVF